VKHAADRVHLRENPQDAVYMNTDGVFRQTTRGFHRPERANVRKRIAKMKNRLRETAAGINLLMWSFSL